MRVGHAGMRTGTHWKAGASFRLRPLNASISMFAWVSPPGFASRNPGSQYNWPNIGAWAVPGPERQVVHQPPVSQLEKSQVSENILNEASCLCLRAVEYLFPAKGLPGWKSGTHIRETQSKLRLIPPRLVTLDFCPDLSKANYFLKWEPDFFLGLCPTYHLFL